MKVSILNLIPVFIIALCFTSCDEVEFPREEGTPPPENSRRALIMDFTGHRCQFCPGAGRLANLIKEDYPDHVKVLTVHPNVLFLNEPDVNSVDGSYTTDWRTPEGNHYHDIYGFTPNDGLPLGVVNGAEYEGAHLTVSGKWRTQVEEMIFQDRPANVQFSADYDQTSRSLNINSTVDFQIESNGSYNLILAVVETDIMDWQKNGVLDTPSDPNFPAGDVPDYIHQHVLRAHINGLVGTPITQGTIEGEEFTFSHSYTISEDLLDENVSIYAYVYNTETLEILDVEEHRIIP